jgi:hypothetical protein
MEVAIRSSYCGTVVMSKFNAESDHVMIVLHFCGWWVRSGASTTPHLNFTSLESYSG